MPVKFNQLNKLRVSILLMMTFNSSIEEKNLSILRMYFLTMLSEEWATTNRNEAFPWEVIQSKNLLPSPH